MYYTMLGTVILLVVGIIVSLLTEPEDPEKLNPDLYAPFLRNYVLKLRKNMGVEEQAELEKLRNPTDKKDSLAEED